jgi:hypothetical protein
MNRLNDFDSVEKPSFTDHRFGGPEKAAPEASEPKNQNSALYDFGHSFAYALVQQPAESVAQVADVVAKTHWLPKVNLLAKPEDTQAYSSNWFAQQIGGALGAVPYVVLLGKTFSKVGSAIGAESKAFYAADANLNAITQKMAVRDAALTGLALDAGTKKSDLAGDASIGDLLAARLKQGAVGAMTFAVSTQGSLSLRNYASNIGMSETMARHQALTASVGGVLSGVPAGFVSANATHAIEPLFNKKFDAKDAWKNWKPYASLEENCEAIVGMGVIGGAMPALHKAAELGNRVAARSTDASLEPATSRPGDSLKKQRAAGF